MPAATRKLPKDLVDREAVPLPTSFGEVTAEFLTEVLQRETPGLVVRSIAISHVTEGTGSRARLTLEYNDTGLDACLPRTMWLKSWFNPLRTLQLKVDGMIGEPIFYRLAPQLPLRAARCYYAGLDQDGQGLVLLEDLVAKHVSFCGATSPLDLPEVADGLDQLARLHGAYWDLPRPGDGLGWPNIVNEGPLGQLMLNEVVPSLPTIINQPHLQGRLPRELASGDRFQLAITKLLNMTSEPPHCLLHFDPHLGNTAKDSDGGVFFIDWQFFRAGDWSHDVSYFITSSLTLENRRRWERILLEHYLKRLQLHGGEPPRFEVAWRRYAASQLYGVFSWVNALLEMQPVETIHTFLRRHLDAVADLQTLELLI